MSPRTESRFIQFSNVFTSVPRICIPLGAIVMLASLTVPWTNAPTALGPVLRSITAFGTILLLVYPMLDLRLTPEWVHIASNAILVAIWIFCLARINYRTAPEVFGAALILTTIGVVGVQRERNRRRVRSIW